MARRTAAISAIFDGHRVDLSNFKFDRDEANNYDEQGRGRYQRAGPFVRRCGLRQASPGRRDSRRSAHHQPSGCFGVPQREAPAAGPAEGAGPGPVQPGFLIVRNRARYPRHPGPCRPPAGPLRLLAYSTPSSWPRRWKRTATCCTRPTSSIISSSRAACGCSTRFGSAAAGGAAFPGGWWCRRVWRRTGSFAHALPQAICGQKPQCGGKAHTGHVALGSNMV